MPKPKLLFHVCCAPCSGLLSHRLAKDFDLAVYYDNPNIWPEEEFNRRAAEAEKYFQSQEVDFIPVKWHHDAWQELARGLEQEPEKGQRCRLCYYYRLKNTAEFARANGFDYFTTSLLISPYKDERTLYNLGLALAKEYGLIFLADDFRADDGFKKALAFAREQGFYRQKYCGCEYSLQNGIIQS